MEIGRIMVWYIMLCKRLLKRWSFILVLLIAPFMVFVMNALSGGSKGVLKILLYQKAESEAAADIIIRLCNEETVILYEMAESENEAEAMVATGKADAVWVFDTVIEDAMQNAVFSHRMKPVVSILQREDTISLMMARERLYSAVYPYLNYQIYVNYVRDELMKDREITDDELLEIYEKNEVQDKLFQRKYINGQNVGQNNDYLIAPVRGLLAVWFVLCGLVSCLYYMLDIKNGVLVRTSNRNSIIKETGYHMVIISIAAAVMISGVMFSGISTSFINEIICMSALVYVTAGYCCLIRRLCLKPQIMTIVIPVLVIMMTGLSSTFVSLKEFAYFRFLHPVYLYNKSVYSPEALIEMLIFGCVLFLICNLLKCSHFPHKINI